jgi:23S rRNA G2069 N7-methylase RlmK/C1962 C5-methylase RlmI
LEEGDVVDVITKGGEFIARGHYQIGSIAVRVLSFEQEAIDARWWQERIAHAKALREALGMVNNADTTCYRLVHGEGDLLPGLVIDVYGRTAVVQCHSVGMYHSRMAIAEAIRNAYAIIEEDGVDVTAEGASVAYETLRSAELSYSSTVRKANKLQDEINKLIFAFLH